MKKTNPYQNHANDLYINKKIRSNQEYLNENIQHSGINMTLGMIIENAKYYAFEAGRRQGRYEASLALKELINVENPGYVDDDDTGGY